MFTDLTSIETDVSSKLLVYKNTNTELYWKSRKINLSLKISNWFILTGYAWNAVDHQRDQPIETLAQVLGLAGVFHLSEDLLSVVPLHVHDNSAKDIAIKVLSRTLHLYRAIKITNFFPKSSDLASQAIGNISLLLRISSWMTRNAFARMTTDGLSSKRITCTMKSCRWHRN